MKVGILTVPNSISYGATLQMYALYHAVNTLGHQAEIINYYSKFMKAENHCQSGGVSDLKYFLKAICSCEYRHCTEFAPTKEILDAYKKGNIDWAQYVARFLPLMETRHATRLFETMFGKYERVCLLCSEPTPEQCHRRLLAEIIQKSAPETTVVHL